MISMKLPLGLVPQVRVLKLDANLGNFSIIAARNRFGRSSPIGQRLWIGDGERVPNLPHPQERSSCRPRKSHRHGCVQIQPMF